MEEVFSRQVLFKFAILAFSILLLLYIRDIFQQRTRIVFCDVGNGDGIYIRVFPNIDILMDTGNGKDMLDCLGKYMPIYDSTIEYVFITHPHKDHYGGYEYIAERYEIRSFVAFDVKAASSSYQGTLKRSREKIGPIMEVFQGDTIKFGNSRIDILWPTYEFAQTAQEQDLKDLNEISLVALLYTKNHTVLFTGDSPPKILAQIAEVSPQYIDVLKVPHHGSRIGLTEEYLDHVRPGHAVISVGENNKYNHPSQEVIDMLHLHSVPFCMTSERGDIILDITSENLKSPC